MLEFNFDKRFKELSGHAPLAWQSRLFRESFATGDLSRVDVIDLPTGLGKTMVMAIWLIAREVNHQLPRRLIYVVDRRTVVDQATELAVELRDRFGKDKVEISTLRGQLADNREWSRDPSKPAIIVGTVDLIGSALLFSGYRSSYKRRPLEAGLLGQDSLLVLDEAHLSKPFEKLITSISSFQSVHGIPMKVIRMSATTTAQEATPFSLNESDLVPEVLDPDGNQVPNPIVERFESPKRLTITTLGAGDNLNLKLAEAAIQLSTDKSLVGKRIVVFVRRPDDAKVVSEAIRKHGATKTKPGLYVDSVEILTGTMRGLERDELIRKPAFTDRWLNGALEPSDASNELPVFLVSTSAGEVGFDLNADHMVCDAAPIDSMIQRLGRVNRRGKGDANVRLFVVSPKMEKGGQPKKLEGLELAIANTVALLREGMNGSDSLDVSPKNISALKSSEGWKHKYAAACSPEPTMVDLTDILLDAWSMTSILAPMPGRPDVAPWIRGIADELPQTTIAWRAELDLPGFNELDLEDIGEWFDTHRVLTHETLSVPTPVVAKWFIDRWAKLSPDQQLAIGPRSVIVDRAGLKLITVKELVDQLDRKSGDSTSSIRNADLILPASFRGIERGKGMLDADAPAVPNDKDQEPTSPDVADEHGRCRKWVIKTEGSAPVNKPVGSGSEPPNAARFTIDLESDDNQRTQLISFVPKKEKLELGEKKQSLREHVDLVRKEIDRILKRLHLPDSIRRAVELAAEFHDHGKNRQRWQRIVKGEATPVGQPWSDITLGKSGGEMKRDPRGYRHEFGSLREFIDAYQGKIEPDIFDLAAHLITVHHGRGRPHFAKGGFDPDAEDRSPDIQTDSIRRFARLQRTYGHWRLAWLENLLRCADALASIDRVTDSKEAEKINP